MTNTQILRSALEKASVSCEEIEFIEKDFSCLVCGEHAQKGAKKNKVLSGNFTDFGNLENLESDMVCCDCARVIKTRELRISNFIADKDKIYLLKKNDLEEYLFNLEKYVNDEFVVGLTRSFKKHNSYRCAVNMNTKKFYIREEDKEYIFDTSICKPLYNILNEMYLFFTKEELLFGDYSMISVMEFGEERFNHCERLIRAHRGTMYFDLLVYMMNSERRNEIVNARLKEKKEQKKKK